MFVRYHFKSHIFIVSSWVSFQGSNISEQIKTAYFENRDLILRTKVYFWKIISQSNITKLKNGS